MQTLASKEVTQDIVRLVAKGIPHRWHTPAALEPDNELATK